MAGYPYGGNPQYPSPQNHIYPQLYNPANAPSPAIPGQPAAMAYPIVPGQNPQFPYQPSFAYSGQTGQAGIPAFPGQPQASVVNVSQHGHPTSMSYPGVGIAPTPTAPPSYGFGLPTVTPLPTIEWIPTTPDQAHTLSDKAIVAGYEGHDGSPLWVIRARFEGELIPGKLAVKHRAAYVPWGGNENVVRHIEVCCANPQAVRWLPSRDGQVPPNAVAGGSSATGEPLYVGRAPHEKSLTPGKVHPSHKSMYISFGGKEVPFKSYDVLCTV